MVTAVTNLGRNGLSDWLIQRVTALVMLAYIIVLGGIVLFCDITYQSWSDLFAQTWMRIFTLAAMLSIAAHAWIGLWTVSTDYLTERLMGPKGNVLRLIFQAVVVAALFVYVVWGIQILWG